MIRNDQICEHFERGSPCLEDALIGCMICKRDTTLEFVGLHPSTRRALLDPLGVRIASDH